MVSLLWYPKPIIGIKSEYYGVLIMVPYMKSLNQNRGSWDDLHGDEPAPAAKGLHHLLESESQ